MGILEEIIKWEKGGASEGDIIARLKTEGMDPIEINKLLDQAKMNEILNKKNPIEGMESSIKDSKEGKIINTKKSLDSEPLPTPAEGVVPQLPETMDEE